MSPSTSLSEQVEAAARVAAAAALESEVRQHLDKSFSDLDFVLGHAGPSNHAGAGRYGKRKRTLKEEIDHWERDEAAAAKDLEATSSTLPSLLEETHTKLQTFLSSASELAQERYIVVDKLAGLITELNTAEGEGGQTLLERMEEMQAELARLEAGRAWASVMEQVLRLSEQTLAPASHRPSPLAVIPHYRSLHELVESLLERLPPSMALLDVIAGIRDTTWSGLREVILKNVLDACEAIKWPSKVHYTSLTPDERRRFERAYSDALYLQIEGENLHDPSSAAWSAGQALYPLQAMVKPIALRFRYHFQGTKSTNRIDKVRPPTLRRIRADPQPEWAFANILDQIYEHTPFLQTILQPLTAQSGYPEVNVRSEFVLALFPTILDLLRSRIPLLLDRPALLAHTVYQTVLFDDAVREGGFLLSGTTVGGGEEGKWEGLTGVILKEEGWFEKWLVGEKKFVDSQLHTIISSQEAWTISDEAMDEDELASGRKPTTSSRQVKALIEQVTDRYSPLPALTHRYPFLLQIQLPTLQTYHQRINGSLDAFESLSSAFARHIPGALAASTRSGVHFDQAQLTSGEAGLGRLIKANLSAEWVVQAMKGWADETFFVGLSAELQGSESLRWRLQDPLLPQAIRAGREGANEVSVFDVFIEKYEAVCERSEDMIVRLVTSEVEGELKEHLKRRWDQSTGETSQPSSHLLSALTTCTLHLRALVSDLPPVLVSRLYRRIVSHLTNHITQRVIFSGWSKFSLAGALELQGEMTDFVSASADILASAPGSNAVAGPVMRPGASEIPWRPLMDKIKILSLPTAEEGGGEGKTLTPTFSQGMAAAWSDSRETLKVFLERVGVRGMDKAELQGVLRRRNECWR